jgi:glycosyltransferase involved in cell wall biosynthesis
MDKTTLSYEIVLVDDGRSDTTLKQLEEIAKRDKRVTVVELRKNFGQTPALAAGFDHAGGEIIISMDGDLQHDPSCLSRFIAAAETGRFSLIIGHRNRRGDGMPWDRQFSNWATSLLLSLICRRRIHDAQCGFRMIRLADIERFPLRTNHYDLETELLLEFARSGGRIGWVDIPTTYLGTHSSMNRFTDTLRFLKVIVFYLLNSRRQYQPAGESLGEGRRIGFPNSSGLAAGSEAATSAARVIRGCKDV